MLHRDYITIRKMIEEMSVGMDLLGNTSLDNFLSDELLK